MDTVALSLTRPFVDAVGRASRENENHSGCSYLPVTFPSKYLRSIIVDNLKG